MIRRILVCAGLAALAAACGPAEERRAPEVEHLNSPEMASLNLPFSEAVRVGDMLYLSGQIGNRPGTLDLVPGGIRAETRQTMENIRTALERYGSSMDRVVKCTIFLADMAEWPAMNEVYRTFFSGPPPARSALGASGLAVGARVEIECIAVLERAAGPGPDAAP
jgi:2-iminobutanoate/2-iminopropanoate deaminase